MGWLKSAFSGQFGKSGNEISNNLGFGGQDNERIKSVGKDIGVERGAMHDSTQGILGQMGAADQQMMGGLKDSWQNYRSQRDPVYQEAYNNQNAAKGEIQGYMNDAKNQYTGTIQPKLQGIMDDAQKEAGSAMSLKDSMDPNNKVAQANRQMYETQAQGEGKRGMADVGMMQAMGAQQMGQQMGAAGVPMTGGQMQAMMGQNMSQAGQAMANTQRRMSNLRDQGIDRGYQQTDLAYGRGQDAKANYRRSVGDVEAAGTRNRNELSGYTNDKGRIDEAQFGLKNQRLGEDLRGDTGLIGQEHDLGMGGLNRQLAADQQFHSGNIEDMQSKLKGIYGDKERKAKQFEGLTSAGAGMLGNMFSGKGTQTGGYGSAGNPGTQPADQSQGGYGNASQEDVDSIYGEMSDDGSQSSGGMMGPPDSHAGSSSGASRQQATNNANANNQANMEGGMLTGMQPGYQVGRPQQQPRHRTRPSHHARRRFG